VLANGTGYLFTKASQETSSNFATETCKRQHGLVATFKVITAMGVWNLIFWDLKSFSQLVGSQQLLEVMWRLSCRVKHSKTTGLCESKRR